MGCFSFWISILFLTAVPYGGGYAFAQAITRSACERTGALMIPERGCFCLHEERLVSAGELKPGLQCGDREHLIFRGMIAAGAAARAKPCTSPSVQPRMPKGLARYCPKHISGNLIKDRSPWFADLVKSPQELCHGKSEYKGQSHDWIELEQLLSSHAEMHVGVSAGYITHPDCLGSGLLGSDVKTNPLDTHERRLAVAEFYSNTKRMEKGEIADIEALASVQALLPESGALQKAECQQLYHSSAKATCQILSDCPKQDGAKRIDDLVNESLPLAVKWKNLKSQLTYLKKNFMNEDQARRGRPGAVSAGEEVRLLEEHLATLEGISPVLKSPIVQQHLVSLTDQLKVGSSDILATDLRSAFVEQLQTNKKALRDKLLSPKGNKYEEKRTCYQALRGPACADFEKFLAGTPPLVLSNAEQAPNAEIQSLMSEVECRSAQRLKISEYKEMASELGLNIALSVVTLGASSAVTLAKSAAYGINLVKATQAAQRVMIGVDALNFGIGLGAAIAGCAEASAEWAKEDAETERAPAGVCGSVSQRTALLQSSSCIQHLVTDVGMNAIPLMAAASGSIEVGKEMSKVVQLSKDAIGRNGNPIQKIRRGIDSLRTRKSRLLAESGRAKFQNVVSSKIPEMQRLSLERALAEFSEDGQESVLKTFDGMLNSELEEMREHLNKNVFSKCAASDQKCLAENAKEFLQSDLLEWQYFSRGREYKAPWFKDLTSDQMKSLNAIRGEFAGLNKEAVEQGIMGLTSKDRAGVLKHLSEMSDQDRLSTAQLLETTLNHHCAVMSPMCKERIAGNFFKQVSADWNQTDAENLYHVLNAFPESADQIASASVLRMKRFLQDRGVQSQVTQVDGRLALDIIQDPKSSMAVARVKMAVEGKAVKIRFDPALLARQKAGGQWIIGENRLYSDAGKLNQIELDSTTFHELVHASSYNSKEKALRTSWMSDIDDFEMWVSYRGSDLYGKTATFDEVDAFLKESKYSRVRSTHLRDISKNTKKGLQHEAVRSLEQAEQIWKHTDLFITKASAEGALLKNTTTYSDRITKKTYLTTEVVSSDGHTVGRLTFQVSGEAANGSAGAKEINEFLALQRQRLDGMEKEIRIERRIQTLSQGKRQDLFPDVWKIISRIPEPKGNTGISLSEKILKAAQEGKVTSQGFGASKTYQIQDGTFSMKYRASTGADGKRKVELVEATGASEKLLSGN